MGHLSYGCFNVFVPLHAVRYHRSGSIKQRNNEKRRGKKTQNRGGKNPVGTKQNQGNWIEREGEAKPRHRKTSETRRREKNTVERKRKKPGRGKRTEPRGLGQNKESRNQSKNKVTNPRNLGPVNPRFQDPYHRSLRPEQGSSKAETKSFFFLPKHNLKREKGKQRRKEKRRSNHFAPADKEKTKGQWSYTGKQKKRATAPSSSAPFFAAQVSFHSLHSISFKCNV